MDKINFIQNKNVIQNTHAFLYKNKKYPFKFDYFKYASRYFSRNQKEFEESKIINLFGSEMDTQANISPEIIENFINFVKKLKR